MATWKQPAPRLKFVRSLGEHVEPDAELIATWRRIDQQREARDRMHRRIIWACVVMLCAWCWGLAVWKVQ